VNTDTNKARISIENGLIAYIPLPKGKGATINLTQGTRLRDIISVRPRLWALYDYADYGLKNYDLLVAMVAIEKNA
jgi:hypothetical protein